MPRFWSISGNTATSVSVVVSTERFASSRASSYTASNDAKVKSSTPAGTAETARGRGASRTRGECRGRGGRTQCERGGGERGDEGPR